MPDSLVRITKARALRKPAESAGAASSLAKPKAKSPQAAGATELAVPHPAPGEPGEPSRGSALIDIPGLDAVGHGIYLRPHQPHELKRVLFRRANYRPVAFKDAEDDYHLPHGYEVDDSPPMPANQFLNQVLIEESLLGWKEFEMEVIRDKAEGLLSARRPDRLASNSRPAFGHE